MCHFESQPSSWVRNLDNLIEMEMFYMLAGEGMISKSLIFI